MVVPGRNAEEMRAVCHIARERTCHRKREPGQIRRHIRNAARRRANAYHVAEIRRIAQRTAHVAAVRQRNHATRERYRAGSGASPASFDEIVWIARWAKDRVEGLRS